MHKDEFVSYALFGLLWKTSEIEKRNKMKRKQKYCVSYGYFGSCACNGYFAGFDFGRKGYMW